MIFNNKKMIKNPMDERNEAFMQASNEATDQYLAENQDNPMAFMDVLKGSITPSQEIQIPYAPETQPQINSIETEENPDGTVEDEITTSNNSTVPNVNQQVQSNPTSPINNYDRILSELRAIRGKSEEDIAAAREKDRNNELLDNLMKSSAIIGDAFANRAGITKIKSQPISLKSNTSERAEADRKRKLEDLMSEYKMLTSKDQAEATRQHRQAMLDMQRLKEERADKYLEEKQRTEDRIANNAEANMIRGILKDDPTYKKVAEQSREFSEIGSMVESAKTGNQAALAALGTKLARAMGEVGVLTDTDVVRYLGSASWARKLQDWYNRGAKGELSPQSIKDIQANIGNIQKALEKSEKEVYNRAASRIQTIYPDMKQDRIYGILGYKPSTSSSTNMSEQDKQALKWARENSGDPRAIKILEKLGM